MTVGLDIGSSAVRAAEVAVAGDGRRVLRRYAQVGLPEGFVVDGEITNIPGVSAALRRLWAEGGFSTTEVVLGVSGPRVFVRQADVPALSKEELRTSLKFDAQEMVPIPMDEASFDFSLLGTPDGQSSDRRQRILLVAAHRDVLRTNIAVLKEAGLSAKVMDAAPLALMRAVPESPVAGQGVEVVVSIGAELTTVAVRQGGVPMFIRSLTIGGSKLTESIANGLHIEMAVAERLKRGAVPAETPQASQARKAMSSEMRSLAEEVRATIDFFVSQAEGAEVERLLVTGGASQTAGLAHAIAGNLPATVLSLDPLARLDTSSLGYEPDQMSRITVGAATAVGLALWPTDAPLIRLSVLPEEVLQAHRARRVMVLCAGGVAAVAGALGVLGAGQILAVHSAQGKVRTADTQIAGLNSQVSKLMASTAVHAQAQARASVVKADLQGDVDWVRVLGQLAGVMPSNLTLTTFNGSHTVAAGTAPASASTGIGTLTFNIKGTGGLPSAAAWLRSLSGDPDLQNVSVGGITVTTNGGTVTFSSTATLTPVSESGRSKGI